MAKAILDVTGLIDAFERTVLPGPRRRVTDDVRAWGQREDRHLSDSRLLEAYNAAAAASVDAARSMAMTYAKDPDRKTVVLGILNEPRATDFHRDIALTALAGNIDRHDLAEFGRINVKQRPSVAPRVAEILRTIDAPEAAFQLQYVIPHLGEEDRAVVLPASLDDEESPDDLLFRALAMPRQALVAIRDGEMSLKGRVAQAASSRDEELIEAGKTAAGLNDYESVLRTELHILVLVAGLPASDVTRKRAQDSLFSLDLARFETTVAPFLPPQEVETYVVRATASGNRRKRADRAQVALRLARKLPAERLDTLREQLISALGDGDELTRFEAAAAMAQASTLSARDRFTLTEAAASLSPTLRHRLQPMLGILGSEASLLPFSQVIEWANAAPPDEAQGRIKQMLLEMQERPDEVDAQSAGEAVAAVWRKPFDQAHLGKEFIDASVSWLREQRGRAAPTRTFLAGAPETALFVLERFGDYAQALDARSARRLLAEAVQAGQKIQPERLGLVAGADLDDARRSRVLVPVLEHSIDRSPGCLERAMDTANCSGLRLLLAIALRKCGEYGRDRRQMEAGKETEKTEALTRMHGHVLAALDMAERDSADNEELRRQLGLVRDALGMDEERSEVPSEAVREWRTVTANRQGLDGDEDPAMGLSFTRAAPTTLVEVMAELDLRAHGRGVSPATDRPHYAEDLERAIRAYSDLAAKSRPDLPRTVTASLQRKVKALTASDADALSRILQRQPVSPERSRQISREIAVAAEGVSLETAEYVVAGLPAGSLQHVAPLLVHAVLGEHTRMKRAHEARESRDQKAAAEVAQKLAVPFQAIESRLFSYFRLRAILESAGWRRVEDRLGKYVSANEIDSSKYNIREGDSAASTERPVFLVRSLGIIYGDKVIDPAVVERTTELEEGTDSDDRD